MNLDLKDRKLLYWLDQSSRMTNKELGKKIRLTEQAVGHRMNKLEKTGVIRKYITFVNTLALGYSHYKVLVRFQNVSPAKEKEILDYLITHPKIRWVVSCSGHWDVNFSIMAISPIEFQETYRTIENNYGNYIAEKSISILVNSPGFSKGHLIGEKSIKINHYCSTEKIEIDELDIRIIKSISQSSRKTSVELARELKTTSDVVRYRIKKMERSGVISGYTLQIGLSKLGLTRASVYLSLHNVTLEIEKKMIGFAQMHNNIIFYLSLIGTYDAALEFEIPSQNVLDETIKKFRELFTNHIKNFEVIYYTDEHKYDFFPFAV